MTCKCSGLLNALIVFFVCFEIISNRRMNEQLNEMHLFTDPAVDNFISPFESNIKFETIYSFIHVTFDALSYMPMQYSRYVPRVPWQNELSHVELVLRKTRFKFQHWIKFWYKSNIFVRVYTMTKCIATRHIFSYIYLMIKCYIFQVRSAQTDLAHSVIKF